MMTYAGRNRSFTRGLTWLFTAAVLTAPAFSLLLGPGEVHAQEHYDVVIRNGRVLDGTGNPWFLADVALTGPRIAAVGDLSAASASTIIDATGLYVAPGFIDAHSHAGEGLASAALSHARPLLAQGITTVFVNPDGGGPTDMGQQRLALLEHRLGVNVAQLVPHGSIRGEVMGSTDRAATTGELARMEALVRAGMEEGAFGLSSGTFYEPGFFAPNEELVALGRVVADFGGTYTSHIRDESDYSIGLMAAVDEVIQVAREAGIPGVVTHVKALGPRVWGFSQAIVHRIDQARAEGVEVWADQYPYTASATSLSAALIPRWAQEGGPEAFRARLLDPESSARIQADVAENLHRRGGADRLQFRRFAEHPEMEGRTLAEVARELGLDPIEATFRLLQEGAPSIVSFNMHDQDLHTLMTQPWTMTASDGDLVEMGVGVPHPRGYGTFPRKLQKYVVEDGVVDLAFAIRSMTSLPAQVFRVANRGLLVPDAHADLVVFDLARIREPGTFSDPHHLTEGMVHVFVNGEAAVSGGEFTGVMAGRVLRR